MASTGVISLATAVSRVLGFVRDWLIARLFGTGIEAQAFVVAFRLPNLLRDFVAEGAATSAVVPVLTTYRSTKSDDEFWRLAQALCVRLGILSTAVGALGILVAPWLVRAIAPGFSGDPEKFQLTVQLTRWLFPFITLVGLWAFFVGLLNSVGHFAVPALGPAVLNLGMIVGCVWLAPRCHPGVLGLVFGVLIGGVVQFAMQLPLARRAGFRWRWVWRHEGAEESVRLLGPRIMGTAVYQIDIFLNTIFASLGNLAGDGAVAALYFANRLVQLPLALFGIASAQASLPVLSQHAAKNDVARFRATLLSVMRAVAFVVLPSSVGLFILAEPIVRVCLQHGQFGAHSTAMTASTLRCFSIGLVGFAASEVLSGAFYALKDTRTPVKLALQALAINTVMALTLLGPLHVGGLALSASLSTSLNAWQLFRRLERRVGASMWPDLLRVSGRLAIASAVMGLACWAAWESLAPAVGTLVALPLVIVGGMLVYGFGCSWLGIEEFAKVRRWLTRSFATR